jgi:hypothetical protein
MLSSKEEDVTTWSTLIIQWLKGQGQKTTVVLLCIIINKSRLGHKEKIIDSVHKPAADSELVAQQALNVHVPNT